MNNFILYIGEIVIKFLGGLLLEYYSTGTSYLIVGTVGLFIILFILKYMKSRVGLNPEDYNEQDIGYIEHN